MAEKKVANKQPFLVAAIDFGTTFSGWAYQYKHDYELNPLKVYAKDWNDGQNISPKTPTTVLIKPDGQTFDSFGYDAEDKYIDLAINGDHEAWFYFRHFKMKLFKEKIIDLGMKIESENGKKLPALLIFSLVISSLKNNLMDQCNKNIVGKIAEEDILWVLTVPAIWNDAAKVFMREAAIKAGIHTDRLVIALEPEAASVYCKHAAMDTESGMTGATADTFSPGTKYIVLDCGGGTIDIDAHEVLDDNNLRQLHKPTGSSWGGTKLNEEFEKLLCEIFGKAVISKFKQTHTDDFVALFRNFEVKKRTISENNNSAAYFPIPFSLIELCKSITGRNIEDTIANSPVSGKVSLARGHKLKLEASVMRSFYDESIKDIISQLELVLHDKRLSGCKTILMVGGYSEAELLRAAIKRKFPQMNIVTPSESSLVVLKGAVMYGRNPQVIASRVCKYTYGIAVDEYYDPEVHSESRMYVDTLGIKKTYGVFYKIVEVGQDVLPNQLYDTEHDFSPVDETITLWVNAVFASPDADPKYIDDPGCFLVGEFDVNCKDKYGNTSDMTFGLMFGGTEIKVRNVLTTTEEETTVTLRLPD